MSVLRHPSPGSWSGIGLMDTSNDELHGHGLFHRDHSQLLCGQGNSLSYPPLGMPPLEPMDTLPAPTSENLLATAGVSRGGRGQSQPRAPTAPGICQMWPTAPQQQDAHSRRARNKEGNPLPAAGLSTSTCHWGAKGHYQDQHRPYHQSGSGCEGRGGQRCQR